jgi:hypothetical protein
MRGVSVSPTPPQLSLWIEAVLWGALVGWLLYLGLAGKRLGSGSLAMSLCLASFPLTAAVVVATEVWEQPQARSFIRLILWMAVTLGVTGVVMWLHHRSDEPRSDGDPDAAPEPPADPEPHWWPDFEREFRDYARRPQERPRQPVA